MCTAKQPDPPPVPPPPPDFLSEQSAIAKEVQEQNQKRVFAGLSSTIVTGASGVLGKTRTTKGPQ